MLDPCAPVYLTSLTGLAQSAYLARLKKNQTGTRLASFGVELGANHSLSTEAKLNAKYADIAAHHVATVWLKPPHVQLASVSSRHTVLATKTASEPTVDLAMEICQ